MSGPLWVPGAEFLKPSAPGGQMEGGPARALWHTTEAPSGGDFYLRMVQVLVGKGDEPHVLYDPLTDRLGQFIPLNLSGRAVGNDGTVRVNRTGVACIQIEVIAYAGVPFTTYWRPGPNFRSLMGAIRAWGIPDVWPAGALSHEGEAVSRDRTTWHTKGGHYAHANVPGNTHWDCGAIDQQAIFNAAPVDAAQPAQEDDDMVRIMRFTDGPAIYVVDHGAGTIRHIDTDEELQWLRAQGIPMLAGDQPRRVISGYTDITKAAA